MYTKFIIATIITIWLIIRFVRSKRKRQRYQNAAERYVNTIFSSQTYRPDVAAGFTYGIPSFTLKFKTNGDKEHAISNRLTEQFLDNIQELCGHLRPQGETFKAEKAVAIYSTDDEKRWSEEAETIRKEKI
jgi:hypothetical protein